mmetsp:Transcript_103685/g.155270  ORF Transcript_103685/g.155270 Transcript_103685/m.155270 type:complete len:202 (+) Transcript_103685:1-606(+)
MISNYRPTQAFINWANAELQTCYAGDDGEIIERPDAPVPPPFDVGFPSNSTEFLAATTPTWGGNGKFKGLMYSPGVQSFSIVDPFFHLYSFEIALDDVELRSMAGKLSGTVGIEYAVDTFLGLSSFQPTGLKLLDTFPVQVPLRLFRSETFTAAVYGYQHVLETVHVRLFTVPRAEGSAASFVEVMGKLASQFLPNEQGGG